jgi:hypothetical protein
MTDIAVRLAGPDDYEAVGELREAAYSHDYEISDHYRESLRDAAPRGDRVRGLGGGRTAHGA